MLCIVRWEVLYYILSRRVLHEAVSVSQFQTRLTLPQALFFKFAGKRRPFMGT